VLEPFQLPFVQRGLIEIAILAVPAGLLGTWIVLRGLAFFSHAAGTAAFPGLVLADGLGFGAPLGAFGAALLFSAGASLLGRREEGRDAAVAIVLVGCLAGGVVLASDVFGTGANVETLLFGSLLLVDDGDIALAAAVAGAVLLASLLLGQRWLAAGFDPGAARPRGIGPGALDAVLLGLVALAIVAALSAVGALLVSALFVVPALTVRLFARRMLTWQLASVALVAAEGTAGLWLSVKTDAPPGATIAVVSGAVFALAAGGRALARTRGGRPLAAATAAAALLLAGCAGASGGDEGRLDVVATTTQIADFARQVGGEAVDVHQILQPNTDPHSYEPRPSDVVATAEADLVLANGDELDGWIGEVVADSGSDAPVVDLGAVVPDRLPGEASGDEASRYDPHWWHDPRNAEAAAGAIGRRFAVADPPRARLYRRRAGAYLAELRALDVGIARCLGSVPAARRKLVTDHDAFGYFARRYGIDVVGAAIPAQATQAQPSAKDLSALAGLIEREGVEAVFPEIALSSKAMVAIAEQTGASSERALYGDALGPAGSDGATYLGMEAANADAMVRGFTGGRRGCPLRP
jgi:ABC-type Zn uptake system ZnuABC Zn-binding protein ZnuA/ABC-type Mn2+/Zn2+ transport system permease subunit